MMKSCEIGNCGANTLRFAILAFLGLAACSRHPRPEAEQAKRDFQKCYPEAEIMRVKLSEDEVIARSFEFTYRKLGDSELKEMEIQYLETEDGRYVIMPKLPKQLP